MQKDGSQRNVEGVAVDNDEKKITLKSLENQKDDGEAKDNYIAP